MTYTFQEAAGTLDTLVKSALPNFQASFQEEVTADLSEPFFEALKWLMLGQAQAIVVEKAIDGKRHNCLPNPYPCQSFDPDGNLSDAVLKLAQKVRNSVDIL